MATKKKKKKKKPKPGTPAYYGLVDDVVMSPSYAHTKNDYKVVEKDPIGYGFVGGQWPQVFPIYRATIYQRDGKKLRVITSYERGDHLMPSKVQDTHPLAAQYHELARLAAMSVRAVETHAAMAMLVKK